MLIQVVNSLMLQHQKRRVEELERQLGDIEHDVGVKQAENERLGLNAEELNVLRSERHNINQVNGKHILYSYVRV